MNNSQTKPKKNQQICLLISGGLDSCVLSHYLLEKQWEVTPIYVQTGLLWESVEIGWVKRFLTHIKSSKLAPLQKISLPVQDIYQSHWSTTGKQTPDAFSNDNEVYLPGRNLVLLVKVALYCAFNNINVIALGPLKQNPFPDSSPEFFHDFQQLVSQALVHKIKIITPFINFSKPDVIRLGKELPLQLTFSCISPIGEEHCGSCNKCAERRRSFKSARMIDKTRYHSLPDL